MCPSHFRFLGGRFRASAGGSPPSPLRWLLLQARRTPQVLVENASNFRTREGGSPSTQLFPHCSPQELDNPCAARTQCEILPTGIGCKIAAHYNG